MDPRTDGRPTMALFLIDVDSGNCSSRIVVDTQRISYVKETTALGPLNYKDEVWEWCMNYRAKTVIASTRRIIQYKICP